MPPALTSQGKICSQKTIRWIVNYYSGNPQGPPLVANFLGWPTHPPPARTSRQASGCTGRPFPRANPKGQRLARELLPRLGAWSEGEDSPHSYPAPRVFTRFSFQPYLTIVLVTVSGTPAVRPVARSPSPQMSMSMYDLYLGDRKRR
jgi:hypothetical protein